jgi:HK97 family phage prohead protease
MTVYKTFAAPPTQLGPRTIRVICSDATVDLAGDVVEPSGIGLKGFLANPVVLWGHNPDHPIGTARNVAVSQGKLMADIEFYPEGTSIKSDEICKLTKLGFIKGISVGFDPVEMNPMDPAKPRGPQRYTKVALMEVSVVSIPANPSAEVIQRAAKSGRVLSSDNANALQEAHDLAEKCRAGIAGVLKGAMGDGFPTGGSQQNPSAPPPPGSGSAQNSSREERMRRARELARRRCAPSRDIRTREGRLALASDLAPIV